MAKKKKKSSGKKKAKSSVQPAVSPKTERQWQVENAARTLMEGEEIRADKGLLAAAKKELGKQQQALSRVIKKV